MPQTENKGFHYELPVKYYVKEPNPAGGGLIEALKEAVVKVLYLQRTNAAHSRLAFKIMGAGADFEKLPDIAREFVLATVDDKIKEDIAKDTVACVNLYFNVKVKEDIDAFLSSLDFVEATTENGEK